MFESTRIQMDDLDRLAVDVACAVCGHNLRGLPLDGVCGECGTPVERAFHASSLSSYPAEWLSRVQQAHSALLWLLLWLWVPLAWPPAWIAIWNASAPTVTDADRGFVFRLTARIVLLLHLLGGSVIIVGIVGSVIEGNTFALPGLVAFSVGLAFVAMLAATLTATRVTCFSASPGTRRVMWMMWGVWLSTVVIAGIVAVMMAVRAHSPWPHSPSIMAIVLVALPGALLILCIPVVLTLLLVTIGHEIDVAMAFARRSGGVLGYRRLQTQTPAKSVDGADADPNARS